MPKKKGLSTRKGMVDKIVLAIRLFGMARRFLSLVKIETILVKRNIIKFCFLLVFMGVLCLSTWLCFLVLLFYYLISLHFSVLISLSVVLLLNILLLLLVFMMIISTKRNINYSETRNQLSSFFSFFAE